MRKIVMGVNRIIAVMFNNHPKVSNGEGIKFPVIEDGFQFVSGDDISFVSGDDFELVDE